MRAISNLHRDKIIKFAGIYRDIFENIINKFSSGDQFITDIGIFRTGFTSEITTFSGRILANEDKYKSFFNIIKDPSEIDKLNDYYDNITLSDKVNVFEHMKNLIEASSELKNNPLDFARADKLRSLINNPRTSQALDIIEKFDAADFARFKTARVSAPSPSSSSSPSSSPSRGRSTDAEPPLSGGSGATRGGSTSLDKLKKGLAWGATTTTAAVSGMFLNPLNTIIGGYALKNFFGEDRKNIFNNNQKIFDIFTEIKNEHLTDNHTGTAAKASIDIFLDSLSQFQGMVAVPTVAGDDKSLMEAYNLFVKLYGPDGLMQDAIDKIYTEGAIIDGMIFFDTLDTKPWKTHRERVDELLQEAAGYAKDTMDALNDNIQKAQASRSQYSNTQPQQTQSTGSFIQSNVTLSNGLTYPVAISSRRPQIPPRFIMYLANGAGPNNLFSSPQFAAFVDPNPASPLAGMGLVPNAVGKMPFDQRLESAIKYCYNNDIDSGEELEQFLKNQITSGQGKLKKLFTNEPEEEVLDRAFDFYKGSSGSQTKTEEGRRRRRLFNRPDVLKISSTNFSQKKQHSINKQSSTMNKLAETNKQKVTVYEDAVKGLEDKLTKSYYAGLNSMYNEKPSAPETDLKSLYGLNNQNSVEMIQAAHPKSVYLSEAMGDGALIENTLEQQAKTEQILFSGPTGNFQSKHAFFGYLDKLAKYAKYSGKAEAYELIKSTINKLENN